MKRILFTAVFMCLIFLGIQAPAQEPVLSATRNTIAANKTKLSDTGLKAEDREKIFREIAYDLNQLAENYFNKNDYEMATELFTEADAYTRKLHESTYTRYNLQLEESEAKLAAYDNEKDSLRKVVLYKIGRTMVSILLSEVITEAKYLNDEKNEKLHLQRLITVSREIKDIKGEAKAYEKLGAIEIDNDKPKEAFELYNKARALRKINNEEWWTIDYIAYAHWQTGEYAMAAASFQEEITLLRKIEVKNADTGFNAILEKMTVRSSLASALFSLAQLRMLQGKYGEATKAVAEVEALLKVLKTGQTDQKDETIKSMLTLTIATHEASLNRMHGRILEAQGKGEEAMVKYLKAIDVFSQLSGGKPSGAIAALRGRLALIYMSIGKFDEARANIKEVLRLRGRLQQQSGIVMALIFASRIERADKQADAALGFSRQAKSAALQLKSADDVMAEANEAEADILTDKSTAGADLGLEEAILKYRKAVEIYRKAEMLPLLARCLNALGWAYEKADKLKEAEGAYTEAVKITESIQSGFSTAAESEAYGGRRETTEMYKRLVDLYVRQGRTEKALQYATRAQRKGLIDAVPKSEIRLRGKAGEDLKVAAVAENKIQAVLNNPEKSKTGSGTQQTGEKIASLGLARQQYALAIKRLEVEQPSIQFTVRPIDLLKLQSTVSPMEAIISYLITDSKLYIFTVTRTSVAVRTVEIGKDQLVKQVTEVRTRLQDFANDFYALSMDAETGFAEEKARPDLRSTDSSAFYKKTLAPINNILTALYKTLITPAEDLLKGVQTIKIIPNAELFLLPFGALIYPDNKQFLIEKYNIVHLTAGDLISPLTPVNVGSMVAFGNPTEADLEGALEEVKAIQKVYPGTKLYTDAAATKDRLFQIKSAKILHLATHGHILNPIELSNIQLAHLPGLKEPDLTYGEIYALPIEAMEMVVLSACQTALGTVSGTEIGVFIEAFRTKAKTVVASLWSVDDMATNMLMTEFYKGLNAGKVRASAMRDAQLKLLRDKRTKSPLFWSAFVMYGDGGKL